MKQARWTDRQIVIKTDKHADRHTQTDKEIDKRESCKEGCAVRGQGNKFA